jgi:hypothetical protein
MPFGIFSYQTRSGLMVIGAEQTAFRPARVLWRHLRETN